MLECLQETPKAQEMDNINGDKKELVAKTESMACALLDPSGGVNHAVGGMVKSLAATLRKRPEKSGRPTSRQAGASGAARRSSSNSP